MQRFSILVYTPQVMDDSSAALQKQAIDAALSSKWEEAVKINQEILDCSPASVEALNRLGRAFFELGNLLKSRKNFESALKCDPYNQIAAKFLKRIEAFKKNKSQKSLPPPPACQLDGDIFLEEPGKTKLIGLLKVAEPHKLSMLSSGLQVNLVQKNRVISVTDYEGGYLGVLPDDLSHHLLRLIHGGNKYQAYIKTIKTNSLSIIIKEIYRALRFRNQPSFLDNSSSTTSFSSNNIILNRDTDDEIETAGEDEDLI